MATFRLHVDDFSKEKVKELLELGVLEKRRVAHMLEKEEQVCIGGNWVNTLGLEAIWCFNLEEVKKHIDKVISGNDIILVKKLPNSRRIELHNSCRIELHNSIYPLIKVTYRHCYLCRGIDNDNDQETSVLHSNLKIPNLLKITIG